MSEDMERLIKVICSNAELREALLEGKSANFAKHGFTDLEVEQLTRWREGLTHEKLREIATYKLCS